MKTIMKTYKAIEPPTDYVETRDFLLSRFYVQRDWRRNEKTPQTESARLVLLSSVFLFLQQPKRDVAFYEAVQNFCDGVPQISDIYRTVKDDYPTAVSKNDCFGYPSQENLESLKKLQPDFDFQGIQKPGREALIRRFTQEIDHKNVSAFPLRLRPLAVTYLVAHKSWGWGKAVRKRVPVKAPVLSLVTSAESLARLKYQGK